MYGPFLELRPMIYPSDWRSPLLILENCLVCRRAGVLRDVYRLGAIQSPGPGVGLAKLELPVPTALPPTDDR